MSIEKQSTQSVTATTNLLYDGSIVEKAFKVALEKLNDGYMCDSIICYAKDHNQARRILLNQIELEEYTLRWSDEKINYLNIPVVRCENADKVIFEGEVVVRYTIEEIIYERERKAKLYEILNNPEVKLFYIKKRGLYYRPNNAGYTELKYEAGIYTKESAVSEALSVRDLFLIEADVAEHNKMITDKIEALKKHLISVVKS